MNLGSGEGRAFIAILSTALALRLMPEFWALDIIAGECFVYDYRLRGALSKPYRP